jgi:hypothetical protein
VAKRKPGQVKYIPSAEVFDGRPFAKMAFDDACEFNYGENCLSLVGRDKLLAALQALDYEDDDTNDELQECIEFLKTLEASIYIDLEDM